jgi:putative nucleotidyltransferase with HDIG domain
VTAISRAQLADELLRRFAAALRASQLYSKGHPLISQNLTALHTAVQPLHRQNPAVVIGIVDDKIIVDEAPSRADGLGGLVKRLIQIGIERITLDKGVTADEFASLLDAISTLEPRTDGELPALPAMAHIRVGRITVGQKIDNAANDMAAFKRLYSESVSVAQAIWDTAKTEAKPDATAARTMVDGLAHAVSQNRTALLALTTLKNYDNYTFTHMVNVSILTMGQARALGIDGPLLREFGLAALMHDIGKVKTPLEILNKPDKLTDDEFKIMKRHVVDGAEILRATPDMPTLAPVVAFEHHLRLDGTGYPHAVNRQSLNLGTMICSIADVYDAMRSQRAYQQAHPSDRILEVLKRSDGQQFDQHLVRRFSQLVGIYPVGNLVRLDSGEVAVVITVYAPDPYRPHVRVIVDKTGTRLEHPYDMNLWERGPGDREHMGTIAQPLDPKEYDLDPLAFL